MYKKIAAPVVALLSVIAFASAHASKDSGYISKSTSPFSVDREKRTAISDDVISSASRNQTLLLRKDALLSKELGSWVNQGGYTLLWNSNRDYIIYNTITLRADSFDNILNELGKLFDSENYGLIIKQYEVNKVIIIDAR
ncbi:pilus assembly protein [Salmonella enterica]|uniref:TcpQ domain-containing protein n=1 Tax=Salmonella enterica TaxID=28901 RepID=UPI0009AF10D3|nr:TcpQ domain-containing protein [Salmonella enterica]ECB7874624.1 pilus assembly protein [Salmonella enterica subsp. enterica serovar Stanley]EBF4234766.1 pilus assembly protein [Salmonella enterica]EDQ7955134.1 pilus assembly protein [Salmonella enterica subsp. enterica serovar Oslo]EGS9941589.1 pilus assembly protein [Salmonella enterica]EHG2547250.1 pilus assembly protein [Salmonella enterica]